MTDNSKKPVSENGSGDSKKLISGYFPLEVAAANFERPANEFYAKNFGNLSKTEIDLMMFEFFVDTARRGDGSELSDYEISRALALTPQRVQNLRTKVALKSPETGDWREPFLQVIKKGAYRVIDNKNEKECEIRLRFNRMIDVYALKDALIKHDLFFDDSFSGLVVDTSLVAVLEIIFYELENAENESSVSVEEWLDGLLRGANINDLPNDLRGSVEKLLGDKRTIDIKNVAICLASGITQATVGALASFVLGGIESLANSKLGLGGPVFTWIKGVFNGLIDGSAQ